LPATLILNYLMSYYPKKKYYKYWGVALPLPLPPPLPQEKRNLNDGPAFASLRSFINLNMIYMYYPSHIVSDLYYHFQICIHLLLYHVIMSCHYVMSSCHTHMSSCHTHIHITLQTKYEYIWIIYM